MLASGLLANWPSSDSASVTRWSWVKYSGKFASILDASDMSLVSMAILEGVVNDFTIGKKEWVAKNGASSVLVYIILAVLLIEFFFLDCKYTNLSSLLKESSVYYSCKPMSC